MSLTNQYSVGRCFPKLRTSAQVHSTSAFFDQNKVIKMADAEFVHFKKKRGRPPSKATDSERKRRKNELDKKRYLSTVHIGKYKPEWDRLKAVFNVPNDPEMANMLLRNMPLPESLPGAEPSEKDER